MKRKMQCFFLTGAISRLNLELYQKCIFRQTELSVHLLSQKASEGLCILSFGQPEALRNRENVQYHLLINDGSGSQIHAFQAS